MSVISTPTKLTVRCDHRPRGQVCPNHYVLDNNNEAMKAANEQLARWGWRTRIDGYVQLHFCKPCSNRVAEFSPRMKVDDPGPQKRVPMSEETKRKVSEAKRRAVARQGESLRSNRAT